MHLNPPNPSLIHWPLFKQGLGKHGSRDLSIKITKIEIDIDSIT
jgi:hypothetical protein